MTTACKVMFYKNVFTDFHSDGLLGMAEWNSFARTLSYSVV